MTTAPDGLYQYGGVPVGGVQAIGMGNVYYVMNPGNALFSTEFITSKVGHYADKSARVHTTIQSALDATVANRNDYVIVYQDSADIDIDAALTMSKRLVHLICPAGIGMNGYGQAIRVHQTGSLSIITLSGTSNEIAGLFFKGATGESIIDISNGVWGANIHDNFFGMYAAYGDTGNYGIHATGATYHFDFHHNYFVCYSPTLLTGNDNAIAGFIGLPSSSNTRGMIRSNVLHTNHNTTVAKGIHVGGLGIFVLDNVLWETPAVAPHQTGIFTVGIQGRADTFLARNLIGMATAANAIEGAPVDGCILNYIGDTGGVLAYTDST